MCSYHPGLEHIVGYTQREYSVPPTYMLASINYLISKSEYLPFFNGFTTKPYLGRETNRSFYQENIGGPYRISRSYSFQPGFFLKDNRQEQKFINSVEEMRHIIDDAFFFTTMQSLPETISIAVCSIDELKQAHASFGQWSDGILGFAVHSKPIRKIFLLQAPLDELLVTLGHELGHVFTDSLATMHDEEAKAFSFSIAWVSAIKKHNIANLASSIKDVFDFKPAKNGLHDVSFGFVQHLMKKGISPMELHWNLVKGYSSLFGFYN